jgi:hypothetical protein
MPLYLVATLEVMDKEWSLPFLWAIFLGLGLAGFFAAHRRPWFAVPPMVFAAILAFGHLAELWDPSVGPAILQEAGRAYVVQSYLAISLGFVLPPLGILSRKRAV